jgi:hypothetical protein
MADGRVSSKYLLYLTKVRYLPRQEIDTPVRHGGMPRQKGESTFSKKDLKNKNTYCLNKVPEHCYADRDRDGKAVLAAIQTIAVDTAAEHPTAPGEL